MLTHISASVLVKQNKYETHRERERETERDRQREKEMVRKKIESPLECENYQMRLFSFSTNEIQIRKRIIIIHL